MNINFKILSFLKFFILFSSNEIDCKLDKGTALNLNQCGTVQVFDITNPNSPSLMTLLKSDRPYSDFGAKVKVSKSFTLITHGNHLNKCFNFKFYDVNNDGEEDLFVSAPLRSDSIALIGQGIQFLTKYKYQTSAIYSIKAILS